MLRLASSGAPAERSTGVVIGTGNGVPQKSFYNADILRGIDADGLFECHQARSEDRQTFARRQGDDGQKIGFSRYTADMPPIPIHPDEKVTQHIGSKAKEPRVALTIFRHRIAFPSLA